MAYQHRVRIWHVDGALLADDDAVRDTADAVRIAEERGDDVALDSAHIVHGLVLSRRATAAERDVALGLLRHGRDAVARRGNLVAATPADIGIAELTAKGESCRARSKVRAALSISSSRTAKCIVLGVATATLVEPLLERGLDTDVQEAAAVIERLAAVPTDPDSS